MSEDICSVETLSRIENGNQNPTKDNYELLMERMGRIRERAYSMLSVSDLQVLEKMKLFEDCIKLYDFEKAEKLLQEIKDKIEDTILDKQFLMRAECLVDYHYKRINSYEYLKGFQEALKLTIPKYGSISMAKWPLSFNEAMLMINISIAYAENEDYTEAINTIQDAYQAMKQSYMEEQQRVILMVTIANNLSKWYGLAGEYEKAIDIANEGIELCKKYRLGNALPNLLYGVAWNKTQLIEMGVLSPESKRECILIMKQAYYIAFAMQLDFAAKFIQGHLEDQYNIRL